MPYHELWRLAGPHQAERIAIVEAPDFERACVIHNTRVGGKMIRSKTGVWSIWGSVVYPNEAAAMKANNDGRPHTQD
jgi:hypothetical protein